jgi:hypothetical protein
LKGLKDACLIHNEERLYLANSAHVIHCMKKLDLLGNHPGLTILDSAAPTEEQKDRQIAVKKMIDDYIEGKYLAPTSSINNEDSMKAEADRIKVNDIILRPFNMEFKTKDGQTRF